MMPLDYSPGLFNVSDISAPTDRVESWRTLARQMQPSKGAGSGDFLAGQPANDAQYLRRFSLVVYGDSSPSIGNGPATQGAVPMGGGSSVLGSGILATQAPLLSSGANPGVPTASQVRTRGQGGLDLSALRCTFYVDKSTHRSPNVLYARIYNMAPATMGKVIEFGRVRVSAGYWFSSFGVIFDGKVTQYVRGKENPTDTFLDIYAGDGDGAINSAVINQRFDKGDTHAKFWKALVAAQQRYDSLLRLGNMQGPLTLMGQNTFKQAYLAHSEVFRAQRDLERAYNFETFIDNGTLHAIHRNDYLPGEAVVLNPRSGLVSIPEVTPQGIQIKCLLNPRLKLGGLVKVDTKLLSGVPYVPGRSSAQTDAQGNVIGPGEPVGGPIDMAAMRRPPAVAAYTSPTGTYKIILMKLSGDTRGLPWYCDLSCIALGTSGKLLAQPGGVFQRWGGPGQLEFENAPGPATQGAVQGTVPATDPAHPPTT